MCPSETSGSIASSAALSGAGEEATDQAYFQAIEEAFVRLRGAPLLLSPKDWRVAQRWHREGVPLALVIEVLEELFARREERGEDRHVSSLRYFDRPVRAAWQHARELTAPGERSSGPGPALDVPGRLAALASGLPASLPDRERFAAGIRTLATAAESGTSVEGIERALAAIQEEATATVLAGVSTKDLARVDDEVEAVLATFVGRLPAEEVEQTRERLRRQRLRGLAGLRTLSLFGAAPGTTDE